MMPERRSTGRLKPRIISETGLTGWRLGLFILLVLVSLGVVLYLVFAPGREGIITQLASTYSFNLLVQETASRLGISELILVFGAFFTLAAFFTAIPSSGGFSSQGARIAGLFLIQQTIYYPLVLILLVSLTSFLDSLLYIIPLAVVMAWNQRYISHDWTYKDYIDFKKGEVGSAVAFSARKFNGLALLAITITIEVFYLVKFNPTLTLLGWFLLAYILFFAVLQLAFTEGLLFQLVNAKRVLITTTTEEPIDGFLVARGEDHILVRTEDQNMLLPMSAVRRIVLQEKQATSTDHNKKNQ